MSRTEIVPQIPRPYLPPEERPAFKSEIAPLAKRSRTALQQMTEYIPMGGGQPLTKRASLDASTVKAFVDDQRQLISKGQATASAELARAELDAIEASGKTARLSVNAILERVSKVEARAGVSKQVIAPEASVLVGHAQIPDRERTIAEGIPFSPPHAHQDTKLVIYEPKVLSTQLQRAIVAEAGSAFANDPELQRKQQIALAIGHVFSIGMRRGAERSTPKGLRNPQVVAKQVADLARLVDLRAKKDPSMEPPAVEVMSRATLQKPDAVRKYLDVVTAYILSEEVANPNRSYEEWQKFYLGLCKEISTQARRMGPEGGDIIAEVIGTLPDVQASILVSRFSDNLMESLRYPALLLAGERRIAQLLKNAAFTDKEKREEHIGMLLSTIADRGTDVDLDFPAIMDHLGSLEYNEYIIAQLWRCSDEDGKAIVLDLLASSPDFGDLHDQYQEKFERYNFRDQNVDKVTRYSKPDDDIRWAQDYVDKHTK